MTTWYLDPEGGNDTDDASASQHAMTLSSLAALNTTQPKFGTRSLDLTSVSNTSSFNTPTSTDWNFGSGQFTIEGWVDWTSHNAAVYELLVGHYTGASNLGWNFGTDTAGALRFFYSTTGADNLSVGAAYTPTLNSWTHLAVDRDASNVIRVYANGVVIASATDGSSFFASTLALWVGNDGNGSRRFPGYIDGVKISKGVARYAGAFTPPVSPPTADANTVLLLNFEPTGTSFATRKKSFAGFTPAAGDTVALMASRDPISLGSATWTDNSGTITLASAVTALVDDFETPWTGAPNVTATAVASGFKSGTKNAQLAIATAFTGGLVAYKAVSNLDLSAYSCLSVIWKTSVALTQKFQIALCSDSAGATPIVTLDPGYLYNSATTNPSFMRFDNGGNPLPSGINSIAVYATGGKPFSSSGNINLDNLIACTAWGSANHLSHGCLIGKNTPGEPEWYALMAINGATVVIGGNTDWNAAAPSRKYRGVSESVTTYALCPTQTKWVSSPNAVPKAGGAQGNPLTITGGWNRTDMSTQTGLTWLSGEWFFGIGLNNSTAFTYCSLPDRTIGFAHYVTTGTANITSGWEYKIAGMTSCNAGATFQGTALYSLDCDFGNLMQMEGAINFTGTAGALVRVRLRRAALAGSYPIAFADGFDDALSDIALGTLDGNNYGMGFSFNGRARVRGAVFRNNLSASVYGGVGTNKGGELLLDRPLLQDTLPVVSIPSPSYSAALRISAANGNAWDNRMYNWYVTERTVTSPVHGSTAQSRQLTVNDYRGVWQLPFCTRLARIACVAGSTVSFSAWQQRSSTSLNVGLMTRAGSVAGVADQTVLGSAAINTWEQVTISFMPTENGVVEVFGLVQTTDTTTNAATATFGDTAVA